MWLPLGFLRIVFSTSMADKWTISSWRLSQWMILLFFKNYIYFSMTWMSQNFPFQSVLQLTHHSPKWKVRGIVIEWWFSFFQKGKKKNKEETWLSDLLKPAQQFRGNSKSLTQWTHDGCISQTHTQQGKRDEQLNTYQMVLHPGCYTYAIAFRMCRPYTILADYTHKKNRKVSVNALSPSLRWTSNINDHSLRAKTTFRRKREGEKETRAYSCSYVLYEQEEATCSQS